MNNLALRENVLAHPKASDGELRKLMNEIETFAPEILGMKGFSMLDTLSEVKRAWWIREEVGIPLHLAESVLAHSENTRIAADCVIEWTPEKIEIHSTFPRMMKLHDLPEYHNILPDITPHDNYTNEQKQLLERYAVLEIERILWNSWIEDVALIQEYIDWKTPNAKNWFILDKLDAWVKAFAYENMWFAKWVAIFHPYTREKISHESYFLNIYDILLEREFLTIDPHLQYFTLLRNWGDYNNFKSKMTEIVNK